MLGPEEHLRTFTREAIVAFRERRWSGRSGGAFIVGNLDHLPANGAVHELMGAVPRPRPAGGRRAGARRSTPTVLVEERDTNQSHLRMLYRPDVAPDDGAGARRVPHLLGRCSAARWARACSTRSASSAAWPTPSSPWTTSPPTTARCSWAPAWTRRSASRRTRACARSSPSCATTGPREEEVERARAYAAGRRVLGFENTNAVASHAARRAIVHREDIDPDAAIAALDAVTFAEVVEVARRVDPDDLAVACVGPHAADDFR